MSTACEMLAALLSERRRGELSAEGARELDDHLAGCARCREEVAGLEAVLAAVELPPVSIEELEALRRIGESPLPLPQSKAWRLPAVLMAAAAAAVLTVSVRPASRHVPPVAPAETAASANEELLAVGSQELFPEITSDDSDDAQASLEEDALSLEGPGLFGNLDR